MADELDSIQSLLKQAHSDAPGLVAVSPEEEAEVQRLEVEKFRAAVVRFKAEVSANRAIRKRVLKFRREGLYAVRPWQWIVLAITVPALLGLGAWGVNRASLVTRSNLAINRGLTEVYAGRADAGLLEMRTAINLGADPATTLLKFGLALKDIEHFDAAIQFLDQAAGSADKQNDLSLMATAAVGAGGIFLKDGKLEEAARRAESVLSIDPRQRDALILKGRVLLVQGRYDEAAEAFVNSIERNPNSLMPRYYLRETYLKWGKVQAARDQEDYLLLARPAGDEDLETLTGYADLLVRQNRLVEAEQVLLDVLSHQRQPTPNILVSLGYLAVENGDLTRAATFAKQAVEFAPQSPLGYILRSEIHYFNGEGREAIADVRKALTIEPNNSKALYNLGCIMLYDLNMIPQALSNLERALANGFDGPFLHYNIGVCQYLLRRPKEALTAYALVPEAVSMTADARWTIANAFLLDGQADTALKFYHELEITREHDPALINNIGVAFEVRGESTAALTQYWRAIRSVLNPAQADTIAQHNIERGIMGKPLTDPWLVMHTTVPLRVKGVLIRGRGRRGL